MIKSCDNTEPHGWHMWPLEVEDPSECLGVNDDGTLVKEEDVVTEQPRVDDPGIDGGITWGSV